MPEPPVEVAGHYPPQDSDGPVIGRSIGFEGVTEFGNRRCRHLRAVALEPCLHTLISIQPQALTGDVSHIGFCSGGLAACALWHAACSVCGHELA
jgi:hypothetical protein